MIARRFRCAPVPACFGGSAHSLAGKGSPWGLNGPFASGVRGVSARTHAAADAQHDLIVRFIQGFPENPCVCA